MSEVAGRSQLPTEETATQFCIMLSAGLPAEQAICYFIDTNDPAELALCLSKWQRSKLVAAAQRKLLGKSWQEMSLEEKIDTALNQHYAALAYLLYSVNYASAGQTEKGKLDSARTAIEAKKAGTAGKLDGMNQFLEDIRLGKVKLMAPLARPN